MRLAPLILLFILSVTLNAHARLGENADQLIARYGQPLTENDQKAGGDKIPLAEVVFQKNGIRIDVTVTDGVSVAEIFHKINGEPFTLAQAQILLADNSQGLGWEAPKTTANGDRTWARDDSATARLTQDGSLIIKSHDLVSKESAAKKAEAKPSLEGF